jgi:hypothetical protein
MMQEQIFAPMGALAALTFLVLTIVPFVRFRAAFAGKVVSDDFRLGESARVPPDVMIPNRNYMNLIQVPVLFYVACLICFAANKVDRTILVLAWTYVALRAAHSAVHLTYNNVFHRLTIFAASSLLLLGMWIYLFARLYG